MFLVEVSVTLASDHRLTDDEVTDLIEDLVDDLDQLPVEPSVGTRRIDDNVEFIVGVTVDQDEEFEALAFGVGIIKAAFQAAGSVALSSSRTTFGRVCCRFKRRRKAGHASPTDRRSIASYEKRGRPSRQRTVDLLDVPV